MKTEDAVAAAIALFDRAKVRLTSPDAIHVERLAFAVGAAVCWGATGAADAHVSRGADYAYICVDERQRGTPRGRFSIAHEIAHLLLHGDVPAEVLARIHATGPENRDEWAIETHANACAAEILMPSALFAPRCTAARPTIDAVDDLAWEFGTSLTATGHRYAHHAESACAFVEAYGGTIHRATRSESFRGAAFRKRALEESTISAALARGEAVDAGARAVVDGAWGRARLGGRSRRDVKMTEHAIAVPEAGAVVALLWHER